MTPIALVGYRTVLQRTEATSTVNIHVCALRVFCAWLATHGYLAVKPATSFKLVNRQALPAPRALKDSQINALLRAAARSRHPARDHAIVQLLL